MRITITGLLLVGSICAYSQKGEQIPMITDRPDATESPRLVPLHSLQIETGSAYEKNEDVGLKIENFTYNTTLLRYGLLENLELRLGWDINEITSEINSIKTIENGFSPLLIGAKVGIVKENGLLPEIGLLGHISHPFTASSDFETETTGVDFRFSFAHTLNEKWSLSYNLGAQWGNDTPEAAYIYTLSFGYSLSDTIGAYAELYGELSENSSPSHLWDAGLTYLITPTIQLDATVGSGINTNQKLLVSAGISVRLPR